MGDRMRRAGLVGAAAFALSGCRLVDAAGGEEPRRPAADAAPCRPMAIVSDDFEDGLVDPVWMPYSDPGAVAMEVDGVLRVLYSGVDPAWAGYRTAEAHDLRGGALGAEIAQVGGYTIIELNAGDTKVQTYAHGGTLFGTVLVAGDTVSEFETDYLPGTQANWRMREADGWIYWETSPDGDAWVEMDARPTPIDAGAAYLLVSGGGVDGDAPAEFESVEVEVPGAGCRPAGSTSAGIDCSDLADQGVPASLCASLGREGER